MIRYKPLLIALVLWLALFEGTVCRAENYALLIGIDAYQQSEITSLTAANADAKALANALIDVADFKSENVHVLTSDGDTKPDRSAITAEINQLAGKVRPGDVVFIAYSGHGSEMDGVSYLLPWDTDIRSDSALQSSALPTTDILAALKNLPAKALILAFDMCRNDPRRAAGSSAHNTLTERQARSLVVTPTEDGSGPNVTVTLFACKPQQYSFECVPKRRGYFSYYLEQGLRREAADSGGVVRVKNLIGYLEKAVYGAVQKDLAQDQIPWSIVEGTGALDLPLASGRPPGHGGDTAVPVHPGNSRQSLFDAAMQKGFEQFLLKNWDGALDQFKTALRLVPASAQAANALGQVYALGNKDSQSAESFYKRATRLKPDFAPPVYNLGALYSVRRDFDAAEAQFRKAMQIDPAFIAPVSALAWLEYQVRHDYAEAERLFLKVIALDSKNAVAYNSLALLYAQIRHDNQRAEHYFRKAILYSPQDGQMHYDYASWLLAQHRRQEAVTEAKLALKFGFKGPRLIFRLLQLEAP